MAPPVLLDDRLLVEELLVGLRTRALRRSAHHVVLVLPGLRAAVVGGGGQLSGPFEQVPPIEQSRAIASLLQLRDDIGLPDPRRIVPVMADLALRHPRLHLLNLEAVAAATILGGTVWLSVAGASGVLPGALDAESIRWKTVSTERFG